MHYSKGQRVVSTEPIIPWYSGYGANPVVVVPAGTEWRISHTDVVPIHGKGTYAVAECIYAGQRQQTTWKRGR